MMRPPIFFPYYSPESGEIRRGGGVPVAPYCLKKLSSNDVKCREHYQEVLKKGAGFYQCPYGFSTYPFTFRDERFVVASVVANPRFRTKAESDRAEAFPAARVSREAIVRNVEFVGEVERLLDAAEEEGRRRLPQALHELRKLNAIVKQNAELLLEVGTESTELKNISGAAELMSNIFEVLEALANLDGLKQIKVDQYVAVYDLAFKAKKIYQIRAKDKPIHIHVSGEMGVGISGSKKTFPIVLTVLLENAIKYGRPESTIDIDVRRDGAHCVLEVRNRSDVPIDSLRCFERGVRFGKEESDGSGLGLYLAREVVLSHGGEITCERRDDLVVMMVRIPLWK